MQTIEQLCSSRRTAIVNLLLQIKQQASFIDRYTQFLAISITDRTLFKFDQEQSDDHENSFNFEFSIAALMLAYKFNEKHHFKLTQFLRFIELPSKYDIVEGKKRILKIEFDLLQALDYQIPQITSYSMLRNSIKSQNQSEVRSEKQIYVKSVKILKEVQPMLGCGLGNSKVCQKWKGNFTSSKNCKVTEGKRFMQIKLVDCQGQLNK